ncbi:hypothetical protein D3H65_03650 [Paraflavitalea soli]|uniref:DUF4595 domain-containing protein n=1 Tax=Paraflavitalea soli TaxID=2315862 RepID=A0A3B7MIZ2_9BACT|nr:hypothetical protein [Paraflavitalea soli]AXY73120.1 hypothetical protein D3H65_03650 [Paraflavitalea soli]
MHARSLFLVFLILSTLACRKGDCPDTPPPPKPGPDIPAVRLVDMNVSRLPAPYYHFTYNDSGYITQLNHSSGLIFYDFTYANKKILKIEANKNIAADINKDRLEYEYLNELPVAIKVFSKQGALYRKCLLGFSSANQLQELTWQLDLGAGLVPEQTLTFSYYPDGNLKTIDYHNFAVGPFLENFYTDTFENYDTKTNADGFSLLHTPLHHPVILPAIKLQLNNPGRVFRTGVLTATFDARYNYTYDGAGRPLTKSGPVTFKELNGTTGQFESMTTYTYN